jgi:hypothetical protein
VIDLHGLRGGDADLAGQRDLAPSGSGTCWLKVRTLPSVPPRQPACVPSDGVIVGIPQSGAAAGGSCTHGEVEASKLPFGNT